MIAELTLANPLTVAISGALLADGWEYFSIPKIVAMLITAAVVAPWVSTKLVEFSRRMFGALP